MERRIRELWRRKHGTEEVSIGDVFPSNYRKRKAILKHLIDRTQLRPRDIISFVNHILEEAINKRRITAGDIDRAEASYSRKRLDALCDEWQDEHPELRECIELLRGKSQKLTVGELSSQVLEDTLLRLSGREESPDRVVALAKRYIESRTKPGDGQPLMVGSVRKEILRVLYKVGAIGIKTSGYESVQFSFEGVETVSSDEFVSRLEIYVVPMLWRALGTRVDEKHKENARS